MCWSTQVLTCTGADCTSADWSCLTIQKAAPCTKAAQWKPCAHCSQCNHTIIPDYKTLSSDVIKTPGCLNGTSRKSDTHSGNQIHRKSGNQIQEIIQEIRYIRKSFRKSDTHDSKNLNILHIIRLSQPKMFASQASCTSICYIHVYYISSWLKLGQISHSITLWSLILDGVINCLSVTLTEWGLAGLRNHKTPWFGQRKIHFEIKTQGNPLEKELFVQTGNEKLLTLALEEISLKYYNFVKYPYPHTTKNHSFVINARLVIFLINYEPHKSSKPNNMKRTK